MADLAIGISKAAVQLLADKVKSALKEEAKQWQIVQRDLVFITGEFEMMQSFLNIADAERVKNDVLRTWVRQVRDLSYDVEDCIEFVLHLDTNKRSWWLRLLPSCGKAGAALPVDEAVTETTLLRARVVDVSRRNLRYNLIVDSGSKPIAQVQSSDAASTSSFDILINAIKKSGLLDLAGLITRKDKDLQVISVCGSEGDLGKVAIIRKVYNDSRISKEFECRAWVKVMHPFNPHKFIRSLMIQFFTHSCQEQEEGIVGLDALTRMQATQEDLTKEFSQKVNTHRFLIILEDISTMVQWDAIRSYLPDKKKGSRIVVLTHQSVIASLCTGEPCRVSELGQFSPDQSILVYFKEGFQHDRVHSFIKEEPYHSSCSYSLIRRDTELDELINRIEKHRLISVWGMPGVGKSFLVRDIYGKLRTSDNFNKQAWVSVSHPFNPTDFSRSLLLDLHSESSLDGKYTKALAAEDPIKECRDLLREYVCLVVIDGVQSMEDWDWIKFNLIQYGDSRSCIIIITTEESVAKNCAVSSNDAVYNIKGLEADAALELFRKVLKENESYLDRSMEEEAELILSKCGGLPKVIITLARYLATKPTDLLIMEMRRLRENFMHELATNPEFDSLRGILAWMHSYLDACPRHLKKSMLYLSIFPQDRIIRRRRLVRRWIAEGYSKGTDSNSMEKYAEKLFDEVAALSIMRPMLKTNKVTRYQVNGFFREYIISRPMEERTFFPVEVSALELGHDRLTTEGIGQHLAIRGIWEEVFENVDFSRLRSLTVFEYFCSFHVSGMMRVLRVLDLENAMNVLNSIFEEIGKLPPRLKFLSLRGQRGISRLPDSVGDLMQLQTLDIRDTSIVTLPPCITRLQKLQYIRAGTTIAWTDDDSWQATPSSSRSRTLVPCLPRFHTRGPVGSRGGSVVVPRGIGRLKALRTLGAVDEDNILREIESLFRRQLKKLEVSGINWKNKGFIESLSLGNHLESLSLQFEEDVHFPHWALYLPSLRSLKMYGHVQELPEDTGALVNLMKLTLEMTTLFTPEVIQVLGRLPSLCTLRLRVNKDQDGELKFPRNGLFSKLQVLEIACKAKLHVSFDEGAMKKLELLKVHCLRGSEMQFSRLEHPVSLKQVWLLMRSFDRALKEALQQQLDRHPKKPAPKLEVEIVTVLAVVSGICSTARTAGAIRFH